MGSTVDWASLKDAPVGELHFLLCMIVNVFESVCVHKQCTKGGGGTKVFGLRSKYSKCCVMCVCVRVCTLFKIPLWQCPIVPKKRSSVTRYCPSAPSRRGCSTAGILTGFRWGCSGWHSTHLPHSPFMKGSHCLTDWGLLIGAEPSLHLPPLPHVPSSSSTSLCVCVCFHKTGWRVWVSTGLGGARWVPHCGRSGCSC